MRRTSCTLLGVVFFFSQQSFGQGPRENHGLIGYGISKYNPQCAFACQAVLVGSQLNCSVPMNMTTVAKGSKVMNMTFITSPECYATDDAFLHSLALCLKSRCTRLPVWQIEKFWITAAVGVMTPQPNPKESYQRALDKAAGMPAGEIVYGNPLNQTSLVSDSDYELHYRTQAMLEWIETQHSKFGLTLLLTGFLLPVCLSLLRFVPFPASFITAINSYLIYPPLWGKRHAVPLPLNAGIMPTRGQALFILYLIAINLALSAAGYHSAQPNFTLESTFFEIGSYVSNRVGVLAFANLPLLILYSGRNNILLWITDWSHATFLLLHRWIGYICILEAALHAGIHLRGYAFKGQYAIMIKQTFWDWGVVAIFSFSFIIPSSVLLFRQKLYEVFLDSHLVLVLLALVGCYLHIWHNFYHQCGYELWIYIAFAVWAFDRLLRLLRLTRCGIGRATVTIIDDDYLRIDIKGIAADGHVYLYFPTLTWRFWENHPFSVASTIHFAPAHNGSEKDAVDNANRDHLQDVEKSPFSAEHEAGETDTKQDWESSLRASGAIHPSGATITTGLTFFMRRRTGITSRLQACTSLPVLVEAHYGRHPILYEYPALVCIAGGVGITATLTHLRSHPGRTTLYWGLRSRKLADAMQEKLPCVEKNVKIGSRFSMRAVVRREISNGEGNLAFFVAGPPSMVDDVRAAVSELASGRLNGQVKLIEASFSW